MHTLALTNASPFSSRFLAWLKERFPFANALLFFILYLATAAVARAGQTGSIDLSLQDLLSCLVTWSFFLLLRVLDEHKDYQLDCQNHPQRVLQSGLINLGHLKLAGLLAVAGQLLWSLWLDRGIGQVTLAWVALLVWTGLMAKEFFIPEWLTRHLTWYAVSHMLVMPLIVWWLANLAVPGCSLTPQLQVMMALAFVSGFCFEITRKTKGPEEERDSIESYSRIFGTRGSALLVLLLVSAMTLNQLWLIQLLLGQLPIWALLVLLAFYALSVRQLLSFIRAPSAALRGKNEACVALTMLAGYAVLIAVVVIEHGLSTYLI
ncbi:MAG: prenyltransferase [Pseudomonadales bacterium RIFCSPLOWO2_12_59_9]|nr:MAG: prenyltransferase [Pseudomonadales bacterium RIFCSPLOWO2_12_59_9]